jgi:GNAT superfamily N-acetyltransferase
MVGAYQDRELIGIIATRSNGSHIALFFVEGNHHRQGIGRKMFQVVAQNCTTADITVNSSPFATEAYHHLGFVDTDQEQNVNGIRFIPMKFTK